MKKLLVVLMALTLVAGFSTVLYAGITGTDHDLKAQTWAGGEICKACHVPHSAIAGQEPLWNQTITTATFTMYSSDTLDNAIAGSPQGVSKLCLSCHDGTVAIGDRLGGAAFISAGSRVGPDLSDEHPISVTYDNTVDTGLKAKPGTLTFYGAGADQVECATCHNPHDNTNDPFLRVTKAASALCLECHDK